jgi:hypothetical protein
VLAVTAACNDFPPPHISFNPPCLTFRTIG